ncbi:MAG: hypothetical protein QF632_00875 [Candidatus Woesearchaeota archaeon]|jgi:hypothetical protein|nr:hypothetical protein [Candidatus Woesearchaeota archaeon]MDP7323294.1 hypothetical protein [Candidatus Woesearchaeota archaeon]MDP7458020.1 hypothetical protein [Candidatus Woesearchaeota archaeon]
MKSILNLFKKPNYMEWNEYSAHIKFISDYFFQQSVRHENIRHLD